MKCIDVAVIGAGPAGAVAAHWLARAGRSVTLIDPAKLPAGPDSSARKKVGESLPGAARPLLRHLGLLSLVENHPQHTPAYGNCSSWGSSELQFMDFIQDVNGLGWHLDRAVFDQDLRFAAKIAGADLKFDKVDIEATADGWLLRIPNQVLFCRWLIDATGRAAIVARNHGSRRIKDDRLMAVYTWIPSNNPDSRTLIEACSLGWWYTSQLADSSRIVSFHTENLLAGELLKTPSLWWQILEQTQHLKSLVKNVSAPIHLHCREAGGARLDRFVGERWLATGDAALSFDPLSSQGIFNAIYTGMKAAQSVNDSLNGKKDALAEYTSRLESIRSAYLSHQFRYYDSERRWPESMFWKTRQKSALNAG